MTTQLKYGKKPAVPGAAKLMLHEYVDLSQLPAIPNSYGHSGKVVDWGMLANDQIGDCAIAAPLHAIKLWAAETGRAVNISDKAAVQNYSDITGYNPNPSPEQIGPNGENLTDQGTAVQQMLEYWRTVGLVDDDGNRHKIAAYVGLTLGRNLLTELWAANYLLDGVIIGIDCPAQWQTAFQKGEPWGAVAFPDYEGGHCILGVDKLDGNDLGLVSWGGRASATPAGLVQNVDEAWAVISQERIDASSGVDANGFNWAQLIADLPKLATAA